MSANEAEKATDTENPTSIGAASAATQGDASVVLNTTATENKNVAADLTKPEVAAGPAQDAAGISAAAASNAVAAPPGPAVINDQTPASVDGSKETTETTKTDSPLQELWKAAQAHKHPEIWGVTLADPSNHVPSQIILQKYLNANDGDLTKGSEQLIKTLDWRAEKQPLELIKKAYSKDKFANLGYVTSYSDDSAAGPEAREVFTWNIYGVVKDFEKTFGDIEAFLEWRVALMELAMHELNLASATVPITAKNDPYKIYQIHDYKSLSFFRSPTVVRTASKKTIEVLATSYPETLQEKFFINVPAIMGFMYGVMKLFVAPKTIKKFHPMSNGGALSAEFTGNKVKNLGEKLPKEYGGKGEELAQIGKEPLLG